MFKRYLLLLFSSLTVFCGNAQENQSDSIQSKPFIKDYWASTSWLPANAPEMKTGNFHVQKSNDRHFLFAMAILILFAAFKLFSPKYVNDLFQMLTRSSIRTRHIKEQLVSNMAASLLLNLFFCVTAGTFVYLIITSGHTNISVSGLFLLFICIVSVMVVYAVKYVGLLGLGWIFQIKEKASDYIFTVFFFNKIMGVLLLPIVVFLLISNKWSALIISFSLVIFFFLFIYRYILAYFSFAKSLQISRFHFFLYFCTVELAPVLVLWKIVLNNYSKII
jgi:VIT1/CCC1 family predicted Fe2+/Mn2+ transporter